MPRRRPRVPPPDLTEKPPKSDRRAGAVLVLLTPEEREEIRAAAERDERPMTAWLRRVALAAARSSPSPPRA